MYTHIMGENYCDQGLIAGADTQQAEYGKRTQEIIQREEFAQVKEHEINSIQQTRLKRVKSSTTSPINSAPTNAERTWATSTKRPTRTIPKRQSSAFPSISSRHGRLISSSSSSSSIFYHNHYEAFFTEGIACYRGRTCLLARRLREKGEGQPREREGWSGLFARLAWDGN